MSIVQGSNRQQPKWAKMRQVGSGAISGCENMGCCHQGLVLNPSFLLDLSIASFLMFGYTEGRCGEME